MLALGPDCPVFILDERHRQHESAPMWTAFVTHLVHRQPAGLAYPMIDGPTFQAMLLDLAMLYWQHRPLITVAAIDAASWKTTRDGVWPVTFGPLLPGLGATAPWCGSGIYMPRARCGGLGT
jgi:hypothetical protein